MSAGTYSYTYKWQYMAFEIVLTVFGSLEKEGNRRATPWRMLEHPWMVDMKTKRVDMAQFLKTVWDWQD